MCGTAIFGVACTPTTATSGTQGIGSSSSANGGASSPASTNTSPFNLHPETDPVIYTTTSGLDIKFGGATLSSGALSGYTYFTMGSYNGTAVNWVIIGRNSKTTSGSAVCGDYSISLAELFTETKYFDAYEIKNWISTYYESTTPQGSAIVGDNITNDFVYVDQNFPLSLNITLSSKEATSTTIDGELDSGEVLCLSEKIITTSTFYASGYSCNYEDSNLKSVMTNLFTTNLGFSDNQKAIIQPQTLNNYHISSSTTANAYLFPLAKRGEKFTISNYLSNRISHTLGTTTAADYWLRSGHYEHHTYYYAYWVSASGAIATEDTTYSTKANLGVRPAFVMKLV